MKKSLRRARAWLMRPPMDSLKSQKTALNSVRKQNAQTTEEINELKKRISSLDGLIADSVRGSAIPYLEDIHRMLDAKQLSFVETLEKIRDERMSFARFGDGEFKNMLRTNYNLRFQPGSPELANALTKVFTSTSADSRCLIGFPTLYRDLHWSRVWIDFWPEVRALIPADQVFGNSRVSRPIFFEKLGQEGVELWRSVWEGRHIVVVTGKDSRMTLVPELFDNVASVDRIDSLPVDAFSDIDRIVDIAHSDAQDRLFLVALGPAGTVLTSKLAQLGHQAIDIGHISDSYETVFNGAAWPEHKPVTRMA